MVKGPKSRKRKEMEIIEIAEELQEEEEKKSRDGANSKGGPTASGRRNS